MKQVKKGDVYIQSDGTIYRLHHLDSKGLIYYSDAIIKGNPKEVDFDVVECGIGIFGRNADRLATKKEITEFEELVSTHKPN